MTASATKQTASAQIRDGKLSLTAEVKEGQVTAAISNGNRIATVFEVVMSKALLEKMRSTFPSHESKLFVDWSGLPSEMGFYRVDRKNRVLTKITEEDAISLKWHERLLVSGSVGYGVGAKKPLNLSIGDYHERLGLYGAYGSSFTARVAQIENGIAEKLRR